MGKDKFTSCPAYAVCFQLTSRPFLANIICMKTLLTFYQKHKKNCYLIAGILLSFVFMIPFLILGTGSIVTYHDQLDGELLNYILAAKYFFTDIRIYPEIMNGLPATGAVPPAPLFVVFYMIFQPFIAFMVSQWMLYLVGFLGMYLLLWKLTGREFISFGVAVVFMLLPFYPVYGLCIPGQPLLFYAVLSLYQEELRPNGGFPVHGAPERSDLPLSRAHSLAPGRKTVLHYILIVFYGAASSPVLAGFACLLVSGIFAVFKTAVSLRAKKKIPLSPWLSAFLLLITYLVFNFDLVRQVLFPENTYVSHKTELMLAPQDALPNLKEIFTSGVAYAKSYPVAIFILALLCLLLFIGRMAVRTFSGKGKLPGKRSSLHTTGQDSVHGTKSDAAYRCYFVRAAWTLFCIFIICLFASFYHGTFVTALRNSSDGILKTFNLDRICWLLPTAWCIFAAYLLTFVAVFFEDQPGSASRLRSALREGILLFTLCLWGINVLFHSALYPNVAKLVKGNDYYALDWDSFFAEDIFSQIDEAIGKPKESYRVVSIGIYPAAAAYNGFYCLDGYSNNYPLTYKHIFRELIEGELEKNDYVRMLFDTWGNRCYITTAEQANYYTFEKKWNSVIYDLDLNKEVLEELNCQYVFSAAYLMNAEENGLSLLRENPFETEGSWYHIYVYQVE